MTTGPRCTACGAPIEHKPGKRPKLYCSDRCRKAVKRALARAAGPAGAPPAQPNPDTGLGTTGETTDTQVTGGFSAPATANPDSGFDAAGTSRDGRHLLRDALSGVTQDDQLAKCGRYALAGGVTAKMTAKGRAYLSGVATCGKVHLCPVCGATIRSTRTAELQAAGVAWESYGGKHQDALVAAREATDRVSAAAAAGDTADTADLDAIDAADGLQAGGLAMLTLTMRHYQRDALADLVTMQREAWKRAFGQNAGRAWRAAKQEFGVTGFVRAWECTHGGNGWHPHWHVLVFFEQPLTPEEGARLEEVMYEAWTTALNRVGARLPDREHGVRLDLSGHGEGGALARYLMKYQDGKTGWSTAAEMTRQDAKQGTNGHRTPFEIARTFLTPEPDADDPDADAWQTDRRLWQEFESGARGIRSLYWSNGLKIRLEPLVELDDRSDGEVAAAEDPTGTPLVVIHADSWHRHIASRPGRSLALLRAAERGGLAAVRALLEHWGLVWGVHATEPPEISTDTAAPTPDEVLANQERARLAARADAWRREFDRQSRVARVGRVVYQPDAWEHRRRRQEQQQDVEHDQDDREAAHADFKARLRATKARSGDLIA